MIPGICLYGASAFMVLAALDMDRRSAPAGSWRRDVSNTEITLIAVMWLPVFLYAVVAAIADAAAATRRR